MLKATIGKEWENMEKGMTAEQFMEWVRDSKVTITLNSYEVREKIMAVDMSFAEVKYNKESKKLSFLNGDSSLMFHANSIENIIKCSDKCCSIKMRIYNMSFFIIKH